MAVDDRVWRFTLDKVRVDLIAHDLPCPIRYSECIRPSDGDEPEVLTLCPDTGESLGVLDGIRPELYDPLVLDFVHRHVPVIIRPKPGMLDASRHKLMELGFTLEGMAPNQ